MHAIRCLLLSFGVWMLCFTIGMGQDAAEPVRSLTISGSEIREIHSKITNQDYELIVNLPYSYKTNPTKHYPVVYFCDGFYDFPLMSGIYGQENYDKTIGECFMVGFSYKGKDLNYDKLRMYDYSPTPEKRDVPTGGAPQFLEVVEKEFIPFIEKTYRIDPSFRVLGGNSMGGLFTLYAMFTKPELFQAYIAIGPAVNWDNGWLYGVEARFHQQHPNLPVSLYMTGAEKEFSYWPEYFESIRFFGSVLQKRHYKDFRYEFKILDDTYHSGAKSEGYYRGLKFVFEPLLQK